MLFSDDDEKLLKTWLERRLSKISDAEAPILAEYCIALLRHDQSEPEVHALCVEQLKDFLKGDTKSFVDDVFQTIKARSYVSVNSKLSTTSVPKVQGAVDNKAAPQRNAVPASNKTIASDSQQFSGLPPMPMPPAEMMMDPNFMQYMQMQMQMPLQEPSAQNGRKKKHCFAFQKNGFCSRGAACPYEHISPAAPAVQRNFHEYDPSFSAMSSGPQIVSQPDQDRQPSRDRGSKDLRHKGPQRDKTKSSLVVENVPEDRLDEESVRRFFEKFGRVENIDIHRKERRVIIKFRDWDTAQSAYTSPGAIFDNRFVKVFWLQERNSTGGRPDGRPTNRATRQASETTMMDIQHDPVALAAKQREHEARMQKKLEMERRALELSEQKASLERRQREGRSLMQQMSTNVMETTTTQQQDSRAALQAQLDTLKAQAAALGITPDQVVPPPAYRGGPHSFTSRGGSAMMRRGRPAPYSLGRKTLDLRPRTIRLTGLKRPVAEIERAANSFTSSSFIHHPSGDSVEITFSTRHEAEAFSVRGQALGEMAWVRTPQPSSSLISSTSHHQHDRETDTTEGDVEVDDFDRDRYDD